MGLEPGRAGYAGDRRLAYYRTVLERTRSIPGVRSAALSLGVLALVRFYSKKNNVFLFLGTGFLGTAVIDGYHAISAEASLAAGAPTGPDSWSWLASRTLLALFFCLNWVGWRRERVMGQAGRVGERLVYTMTALLVGTTILALRVGKGPAAAPPTAEAVPAEKLRHRAAVLVDVVEDRRVARAADDVLLRVRDALVDRLLPGAVGPLVPRRHQVLVAAEHERRRGDPRQPARDVHVAHRLARGGEHLDPVRVAQDLLDRVDRSHALRRLEDPGGRDGKHVAVNAPGVILAVDRHGGGKEPRRVDHVHVYAAAVEGRRSRAETGNCRSIGHDRSECEPQRHPCLGGGGEQLDAHDQPLVHQSKNHQSRRYQ